MIYESTFQNVLKKTECLIAIDYENLHNIFFLKNSKVIKVEDVN